VKIRVSLKLCVTYTLWFDCVVTKIKSVKEDTNNLKDRVLELEGNIDDLEISLTTAVEHGDIIEDQLSENNDLLNLQIQERIHAEDRLKKLVTLISQQKDDLEILIDTIVQHSDAMDFDWLEKMDVVEHCSLTDALTGLANRRSFDEHINNEWRRAIREHTQLSLIMFDVDFFKDFNDSYGHTVGDRCLAEISKNISMCLPRSGDIFARYGGEEFVILLPNTILQGAEEVANDILQLVESIKIPHKQSSVSKYVTISIGVGCCYPRVDSNSTDFVESVNRLLYNAKDTGRNRVVSSKQKLTPFSPKTSIYGRFDPLHAYQKLESLSLSFIPGAAPIEQRWRNNGLSADFLADYMASFFPHHKDEIEFKRLQSEIKNSVSFISNELLENVMKYTDKSCQLASGIDLFLDRKTFIFESYNYINEKSKDEFIVFISRLQNSDPEELYMQQIEENAMSNKSTGLGYLTIINDYNAKASWKFLVTNKNHIKVTTQIKLHI